MVKFVLRIAAYFIVFVLLQQLFAQVAGTLLAFLLLALVLALVNGSARAVLTLITLPLNLVTFGIASVFVNILTLLIADAIICGAVVGGFWMLALCSVLIIAADSMIRWARHGASSNAV